MWPGNTTDVKTLLPVVERIPQLSSVGLLFPGSAHPCRPETALPPALAENRLVAPD